MAKSAPVESLVTVRWLAAIRSWMDGPLNCRSFIRQQHRGKLGGGVFLAELVVADRTPSRDRSDHLLAEQGGSDFNRDADDDGSAGRDQPAKIANHLFSRVRNAMLEYFHAGHDVVAAAMSRLLKFID